MQIFIVEILVWLIIIKLTDTMEGVYRLEIDPPNPSSAIYLDRFDLGYTIKTQGLILGILTDS